MGLYLEYDRSAVTRTACRKMDNLKLIKQNLLQKSRLIAEARCFAVDPLVGIIWVATGKAIYSIHVEDYQVSCLT